MNESGNKRVLSICIPTYNRLDCLRRCLKSFLHDAQALGVDVCVSDNCSTDGTREYLASIKERFSNFNYRIAERNQGIDQNMLTVVRMASTRYAFWLGSDDKMRPGALQRILKDLESKPDLLVSPLLPKMHSHDLGCYTSALEFFSHHGMVGVMGNMHFSTLVVDVEAICRLPDETVNRYASTLHMYAGAVLEYILERDKKGEVAIKVVDYPFAEIDRSLSTKQWNVRNVFFSCIPRFWQILPYEYRRDERCRGQMRKYELTCMCCAFPRLNKYVVWCGYKLDTPRLLSFLERIPGFVCTEHAVRLHGIKLKKCYWFGGLLTSRHIVHRNRFRQCVRKFLGEKNEKEIKDGIKC